MKILLVGVPRSGTTWVGEILSKARDVEFIDEPDTEKTNPLAKKAKEFLGHRPIIPPGERTTVSRRDIRPLTEIWQRTFDDANHFISDYSHIVAKTCASPFMIEWIMELCGVDKLAIVDRKPMNVLSSWMVHARTHHADTPTDVLCRRLAWLFAMQYQEYRRLRMFTPGTVVINYEPLAQLTARHDFGVWQRVVSDLGLEWTDDISDALEEHLKPGDDMKGNPALPGYTRYDHVHRSPEQIDPHIWRERLTPDEYKHFKMELERWGIFS